MPLKAFSISCGVVGACAAAIGVPLSVKEAQSINSIWGKEWAKAYDIDWGGQANISLNNTIRKDICKQLGLNWTTHVNDSDFVASSGVWKYVCHGNGELKKNMNEEVHSKYYQWSVDSDSSKNVIRCMRITQSDSQNSGVNWSLCKKK